MKKPEYRIIKIEYTTFSNYEDGESKLIDLLEAGWEILHIYVVDSTANFILKNNPQ